MGKIKDELLPSSDTSQVGVVGIMTPAFAVGVVGQGRLVAVGIEPTRQPPIRNAGTVGVGQDQSLVEPAKYSPSRDFAPVVVTAQFELCRRVDGFPVVAVLRSEVGMMARPWEVIRSDRSDPCGQTGCASGTLPNRYTAGNDERYTKLHGYIFNKYPNDTDDGVVLPKKLALATMCSVCAGACEYD